MIQKFRERSNGESGFTLVELLVVMLILGLLAAIAIPSFFNQRDKAKDADAKAGVRTAQTAIETYATDNDGSYAAATEAKLELIEPTLKDAGDGGTIGVTPTTKGYAVEVTSETGNKFKITRADAGTTTYTCITTGSGGCPTTGVWAGS